MSNDDVYAPLTKAEYASLMEEGLAEDASVDPQGEPAKDGGIESDPFKDEVEGDPEDMARVGTQTSKPLVKRRVVTKTQISHVAQDIIMNAVLALVENFRNDPSITQRIAELGLSADEFEPVITRQATRVAKALRFEVA